MVLVALFIGMATFVLWYVIDRRAKNRPASSPAAMQQNSGQTPAGQQAGTASVATRTLAPEPPPKKNP